MSILLTLDILKLDKSNEVKLEQLLNILVIFLTCDVSKLDKFKFDNDEQL